MRNYKFKINNVKTMDKELCKFMKVCSICGQLKLVIHFERTAGCRNTRNQCKVCRKSLRNKTHILICSQCGKEFLGRKGKKFCSKECRSIWQSQNLTGDKAPSWRGGDIYFYCDYCGEESHCLKSVYNKSDKHFCSIECRGKYFSGENNPSYNPSLTQKEREQGRTMEGSKQWRKQVYERDNYTCQCCGDNRGHNLNAHHLNSHNWDKENRTNVDNGITLCEKCHKEFHHIYGYGDNTKEQFEEYLQQRNKDNNEVA